MRELSKSNEKLGRGVVGHLDWRIRISGSRERQFSKDGGGGIRRALQCESYTYNYLDPTKLSCAKRAFGAPLTRPHNRFGGPENSTPNI
jgi:hypothetical protein